MFNVGRNAHGAVMPRVFDVTYFNGTAQPTNQSRWNWWERRWHSNDVVAASFVPILPKFPFREDTRSSTWIERKRAKNAQYYEEKKVEILAKRHKKRKKQKEREIAKKKHRAFLSQQVDEGDIVKNDAVYEVDNDDGSFWTCDRCHAANNQKNKGCVYCTLSQLRPIRDSRIRAIEKWKTSEAVNREVDIHLTEEARRTNREAEFEQDEIEDYDSEDEAFDDRDERNLKLYKSHNQHATKGKKRLSQVLMTRLMNVEFWNSLKEDCPSSIQESLRFAHIAFPPREGAGTHGAYARNLKLTDPESVRLYLTKRQVKIFRNREQLCATQDYDRTLHGATGPKGQKILEKMFKFETFHNDRNYKFKKEGIPVVLNSGDAVSFVSNLLKKFARKHLETFVTMAEVDPERNVFVINVTITAVQAQQWREVNGVKLPGCSSLMEKLSVEFKRDLGLIALAVVEGLKADGAIPNELCLPRDEYRAQLWMYFADKLCLSQTDRERVCFGGIAIMLGNGTIIHFDGLNDNRKRYNWVCMGSVIFDATSWGRAMIKWLVERNLNPQALSVQIIVYTRNIVGVKADQLKYGYNLNCRCVAQLKMDIDKEEFKDVQLINKDWLRAMFEDDVIQIANGVIACSRPEGMSKLLYYGSMLDGLLAFLSSMKKNLGITPKVKDLLDGLAFIVRYVNGQWLLSTVFEELIQGRYRDDMNRGAVLRGWRQSHGNVFVLLSLQASYEVRKNEAEELIKKQKSDPNVRPKERIYFGSKMNRHMPLVVPLIERPEQFQEAYAYLDFFASVIEEARYSQDPEKVYAKATSSKKGMGHLSSMHMIHLLGLSGIGVPKFLSFARANDSMKYGPAKFFDEYGDHDGKLDVIASFNEFVENVSRSGMSGLSERELENYGCIKGRGKYRRKELIFSRGNNVQVFFKTNTKGDVRVMVEEKWHDVSMVLKPLCRSEWSWTDTLPFGELAQEKWPVGARL